MLNYFTDPLLWAPTIGSILMCVASSLIGVVAFLRKRCLLAEALSHSAYPGIVIGALLLATVFTSVGEFASLVILGCAFLSSLGGLLLVEFMERRLGVKSDAALCFALSVLFGIGILIASRIQMTHPLWYNQIHLFLYGQVATMTALHVGIYSILLAATVFFLFFLYRPLQLINFDRQLAKTLGARVKLVDALLFLLLVLAIVIGIRSVGVVLMSGMLVAPAVAARQLTHRMWLLFVLAGAFGALSGFFGNFLSMELPKLFDQGEAISLPTGPMILLSASLICALSLLFSPTTGLFSRILRIARFKDKCRLENALKALWRGGEGWQRASGKVSTFQLYRLLFKGWVEKGEKGQFRLSEKGRRRSAEIVRLHRLWELYLVSLGQGVEKVHHSAEEMEHILTPHLERELTEFLEDPTHDPHQQPIPGRIHV
ncbi:MAG: metal ABC transporter permease [Chlamydiales bacterium]|nr:metal ABC transporter permease [Chlamydiales bacterium]